jgi:hypothetical protein
MENLLFDTMENIGGPPIPFYPQCQVQPIALTFEAKKIAYENFVNSTGYDLFDATKITTNTLNTSNTIVNNTSFYVFFTLFLLLLILLFFMMVTNMIDIVVGLHLLVLFSLIIYTMSVVYRRSTLVNINAATANLAQEIIANKMLYEQSVATMLL